MVRKGKLLSCFYILVGALVSVPFPSAAESTNEISILFVGNSFTFYNNLPTMITQLAKAGGQKPLAVAMETPGGYTLEQHWKDGKALVAIHSRKWDYVVLQEQSRRPVERKDLMFEYGRKFDEAVRLQGGKTLLYLTWAWPTSADQPALTLAYQELARDLNAQVVPVGIAWNTALQKHPEIGLFAKDNRHPSPAGSYLAACVFYAIIYGRSPVGVPFSVPELSHANTRLLQELAHSVVQENASK